MRFNKLNIFNYEYFKKRAKKKKKSLFSISGETLILIIFGFLALIIVSIIIVKAITSFLN